MLYRTGLCGYDKYVRHLLEPPAHTGIRDILGVVRKLRYALGGGGFEKVVFCVA